MTNAMLPPDDEIVSAVLDGEATADERARVEADPAARGRRAELADIRRQVAASVPVPGEARERALAAALAEFDQQRPADPVVAIAAGPVGSVAESEAGVDPLPAASDELAARRARRSARTARYLAAAAAVVVVLVGIGALVRSTGQQADLASTGLAPDQPEVSTLDPSGGADLTPGETPAMAPTTTISPAQTNPTTLAPVPGEDVEPAGDPTPVDLGVVSTPAQLRTLMVGTLDQQTADTRSATTTTSGAGGPASAAAFSSCEAALSGGDPEIAQVLTTATATYQGRPALVFAFAVDRVNHPAANGSVRIYAVASDDCSSLSVQTVR